MENDKIHCSVGVMAYNEEKNIAAVLAGLLNQRLKHVVVDEIIVVSSGSTDKTDIIVQEFAEKHDKIKLIVQNERKGKSSAINLFMKNAQNDILVVESADTVPASEAVEKLVRPFRNQRVGMTGGRPIPCNDDSDFVGFSVQLLWRLHHKMAKFKPKLGEMVAFRKVFCSIPEKSAVDEASIEALITAAKLECLYVSDAFVYNMGPTNICDFIKQRKRIAIGHLWLKDNQDYSVTSNQACLLFGLSVQECIRSPKDIAKIIMVAKLEMFCRLLGFIEYRFRNANPFIWEMVDR